jgi:hypothetical protein
VTKRKPRINDAFVNHVRESSCSTERKGQWYPDVTVGAENKWTESVNSSLLVCLNKVISTQDPTPAMEENNLIIFSFL